MPESIAKMDAGNYFSLFLSPLGHVYSTGENTEGQLGTGNERYTNIPLKIPGLNKVEKIACSSHCLAID